MVSANGLNSPIKSYRLAGLIKSIICGLQEITSPVKIQAESERMEKTTIINRYAFNTRSLGYLKQSRSPFGDTYMLIMKEFNTQLHQWTDLLDRESTKTHRLNLYCRPTEPNGHMQNISFHK